MHSVNSFITLTYDDDHLPFRGSLDYSQFQRFMKRLRKRFGVVRFYMCGEYGPENMRPHFHACLFGVDFDDKVYWSRSPAGERIYRSAVLESLWPFGFASVGSVTFESAAYVARYCVAKITGFNARYYYARVDDEGHYMLTPEFNRMSLKPGIGASWLAKFAADVFPRDYVIVNGVQCRVPDYYDKLFERVSPDQFDDIKAARVVDALSRAEDNTDDRLAVKEVVQRARVRSLKRSL